MVATTTAAVGVAAALALQHLPKFSIPNVSPTTDGAIKAIAGIALIIAGAKVDNGYAKAAVIGVGAGLLVGGAYIVYQQRGA